MPFFELFIIAIGLAMDAFAVSVCKGLSLEEISFDKSAIVGGYFGFFQGFMPIIGYLLGIRFRGSIEAIDHWIAFVLLFIIGANMIKEALTEDSCSVDNSLSIKTMVVLALATSIDAILKVNIITSAIIIGVVTFAISFMGVNIGYEFGCKYKYKAEIFGGIILIFMGTKILLTHLGII